MKRFLAILMVFAMVIAMIPAFADVEAAALSGKCGSNLRYKMTATGNKNRYGDDIYVVTITGSGKMYDYEVDWASGMSSAPWAKYYDIDRIELPEGLTYIGDFAFYLAECEITGELEVNIPETVTAIGEGAFECAPLGSVTIPEKVKSIGKYAFYYPGYDNYGDLYAVYVFSKNVKYGEYVFDMAARMGGLPVIYGYKGSTTETYCKKNDLNFEVLKETPVENIELDKSEVTLEKGKSVKVGATVLPANAYNKKLKWTSADKSIAKVNSKGKITGVKGGTTVIAAAAKDGSGVKATVTVTVIPTQVEKIELNKKKVKLMTGEKVKLVAKVSPSDADDKSVIWTSSDPAIATVNAKGKVKAVAPGKCVITATSANGKTATCKITVKAVKVTAITVKGQKKMAIGTTQQLEATVQPVKAYDKSVTWASSDEAIATVDANGVVTAVAKGKVTITCTANDGSKVTGKIVIKVK